MFGWRIRQPLLKVIDERQTPVPSFFLKPFSKYSRMLTRSNQLQEFRLWRIRDALGWGVVTACLGDMGKDFLDTPFLN